MNAEMLFWAGVTLLSPTFFIIGKYITRYILDVIVPDDRVVVSYTTSAGHKSSKVVHLSSEDELSKVLRDVRATHARRRGKHA